MKTKHPLKIKAVLALLIPFVTYSCGGSSAEDKSENSASNYKLEVFDSLQFDILTQAIRIADVDTKTGDMLVFQPYKDPKAWLFDKSYNILAEFERPDGDPEGTGRYIFTGSFFEEGIALMGHTTVNLYDREFNFRKRMKPNYGPSQLLMPGQKHLYDFVDGAGNTLLVTYFGQPQTELWGALPDYYDEFNIVDVVNPKDYRSPTDTVFQAIGKLTPDSQYRSGRAFYMLQPRFDVSGDKLHYVLKHDTTLFTLQLPEGNIIESYTIPYDEFILFSGYSMGNEGIKEQSQPRDRNGRVETINHSGEFDVVVYHSGLRLTEMQKYDSETPNLGELLAEADYKKHLIIKDGKRVNSEIRLNPKVSSIQFVDDDGVFYASQNLQALEKEPEKYTIYKLRIVEDN